MVEGIQTIVTKGFNTWIKNINICIPFILETITTLLLFFFSALVLTVVFIAPSITSQNIDTSNLSPEDITAAVGSIATSQIGAVLILGILFIIIYLLIHSYFRAGAIGMAKAASEKGYTDLGDMFYAGKSNYMNLFLTKVLIYMLALAGLILVLPGIVAMGGFRSMITDPQSVIAGSLLLVLGVSLWVLYLLVLNIILILVDYALVADNLDPITGIEKGILVFLTNKLTVFAAWILVNGITIFFILIGQLAHGIDLISQIWTFLDFIIGIIIIQPLLTVWLTRLYLARTNRKLYSFEDYVVEH